MFISLCNVFLGGYFHGRNHLTYGVDVGKIRWLGVLQVPLWLIGLEVCFIFFSGFNYEWFGYMKCHSLLSSCMLKVCAYNLQRISIGYLLASISEIWLVNNIMVDSLADLARKYYTQWLVLLDISVDAHICNLISICVCLCETKNITF